VGLAKGYSSTPAFAKGGFVFHVFLVDLCACTSAAGADFQGGGTWSSSNLWWSCWCPGSL